MDDASKRLREAMSPPPRMTQGKLAEDLGVTAQAVSNWCSGRARPEPKHRKRIEELTGIPRTAWMTDEEREAAGIGEDGAAA